MVCFKGIQGMHTCVLERLADRRAGKTVRRKILCRNAACCLQGTTQEVGLWIRCIFQTGTTSRICLTGNHKLFESRRSAKGVGSL